LVRQLFVFRGLLRSLPEILIKNHEGQHVTWLTAEVCAVQEKLEKQLATSEEEKNSNFYGLKVSLGEKELQTLNSKEELRQQQLLSATLSTHLELQECLSRRAEEFVTSLSSLTEKLLHLLDELLIAEEPDPAKPPSAVTTATEAGSELRGSREWLAIARRLANLNLAESFIPSAASITTARSSRNLVIEQRDAALKRFQQLIQSEESSSDVSKQKQLGKQHSWTSYWKQQILAMRKFKGYVTPSEDN
ncbi:PREDICTED: coiled-coil domain-containing protein 180-like, partial [Cyprinodon variegatus]|uniref:coiled-coil domain-containing protein 180-like n=1 Tax=Cyprinodon variegatus TaxID=28743 RepID=UPI0007425445